jgi:hypothetical protein
MKSNNLFQFIGGSIGLAIGIYYTVKYTGLALISVIGDGTQAIAVLALASFIAACTLLKNKKYQAK